MANRQEELLPILKALREYISKEYAVNYPPHVRGEDAANKELPANWQDKLDPITGGDTTGRDTFGSSGQNSTKAGSQSEDAYIHKSELEQILKDFVAKHYVDGEDVQQTGSRGANAGFTYPGEERRVPEGLEKHHGEMGKNEDENGMGEEEEDENGMPTMEEAGEEDDLMDEEEEGAEDEEMEGVAAGHMSYSNDNVNSLLKDIKTLLVQKQTERSEFGSLKKEMDSIKKSMPSQIKQGVTAGMKKFNLNPSVTDQATRVPVDSASRRSANPVPSALAPTADPMPDKRIGVEGDSFAKTDSSDANWQAQEQFTDAVEQILGGNDADDIRGTFKKVNSMRNQSGELTPQTLYYYGKGGAK